ncbi:arylsulfatase [Prosthecobacter sp.]|uniref:sulfatase family protein n=1 Tax=Prosthecobacter sp. TaxID=1965333 RepID=UPI0024886F6C|nr:arylsulfatase [Prosthecobacter sp.]MDI1312321.1 arylsulfatase [Prosthecobacter sp.]
MNRFFALTTLLCLAFAVTASAGDKPNIIFILCDDLGYGDVKCLNPDGKIATPSFDRLAKEGMIFTDAHSGSSVCTPTRYGVMTGRYAWRSKLQSGVLGGLSPRLIEQGRQTVASMLKAQGYSTHCVGKWHMGMDWERTGPTEELNIEKAEQVNNVDYTKPITNGPNSVGFDTYFGISASLDMVPYCFIENDHVVANPTETMKLVMNKGGPVSYTREGPGSPGFRGEDVLPTFTREAKKVIAAKAKEGAPFFLYMPLNSPHTPILPSEKWQGKSGINAYADFVMETDDAIGQIMRATEEAGIAKDTLFIVTSDNGCSPSADYPKLIAAGHNPSYNMRGHKADIFDGGHRVPFIVRWPAKVKGGQTSAQIVCLTDFMATAADAVDAKLPETAAEDSFSILPALLGESGKPVRQSVIHHSINGSFALREGDWKLELCAGSGGWSDPRPGSPGEKGLPDTQLYNLKTDISEKDNVQAGHPEIVAKMTAELEQIVTSGRSSSGAAQQNAVPVVLRKPTPAAKPKGKKKVK